MTTFYTSSRTPTEDANLSETVILRKGLPFGWYQEEATVSATHKGTNGVGVFIGMGEWDYRECVCDIECSIGADAQVIKDEATGEPAYKNYVHTPIRKICPVTEEFAFEARVNSPSATVPTDFLLTFTDVFGNIRRLTISLIKWLTIKAPVVVITSYPDPGTQYAPGLKPDTYAAEITVPFQSSDSTDIKSSVSAYQVQRYIGHQGVLDLIRGWTEVGPDSNPDDEVWDYLLRPGREYGYRVRYRAYDGDETAWSDWETVTI